jgi:hypothetical protein
MTTGRLSPSPHCWSCGEEIDGWTSLQEGMPSPGDVSICFYCAAVGIFDKGLASVRKATSRELESLIENRDFIRACVAIICARSGGKARRSPAAEDDDGASTVRK